MRNVLLAFLLLVAGLAGCASKTPDPVQQAADEAAVYDAIERQIGTPLTDDGFDPNLPAVNLERLYAVTGPSERTAGVAEGYIETAVKDGYAYLCRSGTDEGLVIFDVHDIEDPLFVGSIRLSAGFEADIEVSDDGNWAFWETQRLPGFGVPDATDPTSAPGAAPYGIHIIDISDKANPRWAGFTPVPPNGPHSITYANIGGEDYVYASVYSWQYVGTSVTPVRLAPPGMQRLVTYRLDDGAAGPQLVEVASYIDEGALGESVMPADEKMPHDVSIAVHPFTNRTYAYVAYWNLGVVILDVTDPAHPVKVGAATDFGAAPTREIHMARQSELPIDGKVIVVAEPEISGQETTGYMSVIDVSDPANPAFVSNWRIPGNATSGGGGRGPHYFDFHDGRVVMASYSAGFWVFDIHDAANLAHPRTVAYAAVPAGGGLFGGSAFDAWWADPTHIVGSESGNGLVVFRYLGPAPAIDEPATTSA
ncbi:MAG: hypothetical protein QOJ26_217 [Thermoplasmata archaeon]|jgi:hypothetical protein|nr:hypothetical protein [Thermoplasmata archaeon]MEA3165373.1 hypothetical protein [Thermoplasmata archaeon]